MKTPREILLAKHQSSDAKLDKIRRSALAQLEGNAEASPLRLAAVVQSLWRELVLPKPRAWVAVATLWILILALKFATHDGTPVVAKKTTLSPQVMAELKQQKAFFGELAGPPPSPGANPPETVPPRPRSSRNPEFSGA